ncbi:MAG: YfaZ family outer membrane protein [Campylobacterota bacterium]|nr:YfaZ family outer membrane protein [Campylobacterota bacterium]
MLKKISLIVACAASAFALHTAEININDKDLEIGAQFDVGQFNKAVEPETMFLGIKFLNPDASHSEDDNLSINPYFEGNFLIMKEVGKLGMSFGMGIKLNYSKIEDSDLSSLPLGVAFAYVIPAKELVPMSIEGSLYYAPQVLTFLDAQEYLGYRIHYDIELIENAGVTFGYRSLNATFKEDSIDTNKKTLNYNSSFYFGFKVKF